MSVEKRPHTPASPEKTRTSDDPHDKPKRKKEWTREAMEEEFRKPHFGGNDDEIADDDREALED